MSKIVTDQQILDATLKTIVEQGYSGATTRQIAEAAAVNEVTLFRRFGSKKNMLLASVERQLAQLAEEGIRYSGDLEADLIRIATFYGCLAKNKGKLFPVLMAELPRQPELIEVLEKPLAALMHMVSIVQRYQEEGKLVLENPSYTVANLVGPIILTEMLREIHGPTIFPQVDIPHHVKTFLQGRAL